MLREPLVLRFGEFRRPTVEIGTRNASIDSNQCGPVWHLLTSAWRLTVASRGRVHRQQAQWSAKCNLSQPKDAIVAIEAALLVPDGVPGYDCDSPPYRGAFLVSWCHKSNAHLAKNVALCA